MTKKLMFIQLALIMGFFFGPYSPKFYDLVDKDIDYLGNCEDYFIYPNKHDSKFFWDNYLAYVNVEVSMQRFLNRSWNIESPFQIKTDGQEIKAHLDLMDAELDNIRKHKDMFK